ncbi:MAG: septum site-determining protein MinC [Anaerolineaceae bacterium]|nr:septum site-determining protein MinC [Anaerolineaceae bacterium]
MPLQGASDARIIREIRSAIMEPGEHGMSEKLKSPMQIKGIREGLLVSLGGGNFQDAQKALLEQIDHQIAFFRGARLALDTGSTLIKAGELGGLRDQLADMGILLWAVIAAEQVTETNARRLGLTTRFGENKPEKNTPEVHTGMDANKSALMVHRTLRSGVHLEHDGHVTVVGDVNPGAEVSATGNVVVWGHLHGSVHAGSRGDEKAFICALEMAPTFIHIADLITQPQVRRGKSQPEMARIFNDTIIIEAWKV